MNDPTAITTMAMHEQAAQKRAKLEQLVQRIHAQRPGVVVEIGTMKGGTLRAWCECAADDALIVSIDLPHGEWGGGYNDDDASRFRGFRRADQRLELIQGNSHDFMVQDRLERVLDGREIDLLFIDGDHTYPGVKQDFEDYSPYVRSGGLIAFHDVIDHPNVENCDVNLLWDEIKDRYETEEFVVPGDERSYGPWGGIGLLRWP